MSGDAQYDILSARLDTLESEVLAFGPVGDDANGVDANDNPSIKDADPKGRSIWEAQWSEDDKALWCYVPGCALVIDGNEVPVDAEASEDRKDDEIKLSEGVWYLQVFEFGDSASYSATLTADPKQGDENLKYSIKIISVTKDGTVDNQYAVGAIVLALGGTEGGNNEYFADERSISQMADSGGGDPTQMQSSNFFHLYGFGKFSVRGKAEPIGTYAGPSSADVAMEEETEFAVLCRDGNSPAADSNFLSYKRLKIKASPGETPFEYRVSTSFDEKTGEQVSLHELKHCFFYFNGAPVSLPDFDVSGLLGSGIVYLRGVQAKPSEDVPSPAWDWSIGGEEVEAPEGGRVQNIRLYEFAQSKVKIDYRTTFLALADPAAQLVRLSVGERNVHLQITGSPEAGYQLSVPELTMNISGGQGIRVVSLPQTVSISNTGVLGLSGNVGEPLNGDVQVAGVDGSGLRVVAVRAVQPVEGQPYSGGRLSLDVEGRGKDERLALQEVTLDGDEEPVARVFGTDSFEISQKKLKAGHGIEITENEDGTELEIKLGGGELYSGEKEVVVDVGYDSSSHSLWKRTATMKFKDGMLVDWVESPARVAYTTAVEET